MAETVIGPNIQIEGDIAGADALAVHGSVRGGRIQVKEGVVIHASGRIEGDVERQPLIHAETLRQICLTVKQNCDPRNTDVWCQAPNVGYQPV